MGHITVLRIFGATRLPSPDFWKQGMLLLRLGGLGGFKVLMRSPADWQRTPEFVKEIADMDEANSFASDLVLERSVKLSWRTSYKFVDCTKPFSENGWESAEKAE